MSLFEPSMAEQAALQERLRLLHESAEKGAGMTPMQALDERIAQGDADAMALKANILNFRSNAQTVCEKEPKISRAVTLQVPKTCFHSQGATLHAAKPAFAAKKL